MGNSQGEVERRAPHLLGAELISRLSLVTLRLPHILFHLPLLPLAFFPHLIDLTLADLRLGLHRKIGAILVCINPASSAAELSAALHLTGSSTLFICPQIRGRALIPLLHDLLPSLQSTPADQDLQEEGELSGLKRVVLCDSSPLGGKGFGEMLDEHKIGKGRDLRHVFDWEGEGVEGAEECFPDDGK